MSNSYNPKEALASFESFVGDAKNAISKGHFVSVKLEVQEPRHDLYCGSFLEIVWDNHAEVAESRGEDA